MRSQLKRIAALLPERVQQALKRRFFAWQIRRGTFGTDEPEFARLASWVGPGDWSIDIGANVGHYTACLSGLVGEGGRVLALEPQPQSFEILTANVRQLEQANVTLLNVAASDHCALVGMSVPSFETGLKNYYMAQLSADASDGVVLCLRIDALELPERIALVKIDAEGHELSVIRGMRELLARDQPTLIVEVSGAEVLDELASLRLHGQPASRLAEPRFARRAPQTRKKHHLRA